VQVVIFVFLKHGLIFKRTQTSIGFTSQVASCCPIVRSFTLDLALNPIHAVSLSKSLVEDFPILEEATHQLHRLQRQCTKETFFTSNGKKSSCKNFNVDHECNAKSM